MPFRNLTEKRYINNCVKAVYANKIYGTYPILLKMLYPYLYIFNSRRCVICGKVRRNINRHYMKYHKEEIVLLCRKLLEIQIAIQKHITSNPTKKGTVYVCMICRKRYLHMNDIFIHMIKEHFKDMICREIGRYLNCELL